MNLSTRVLTRVSFAALCIGLLAGVLVLSVANWTSADAQGAPPPEPRRTAYVDFLGLLKNDNLLKGRQSEVADDVERQSDEIDRKWRLVIEDLIAIRKRNKPDTPQYRKAMADQVEAARKAYAEKLTLEQYAQADLRDYAIKRFTELRTLCREIALSLGYNEVLNIVRNIEDVAGSQDDFQALQQQLLVSPVLYFEKAHDITDIVAQKADEKWGSRIEVKDLVFVLEGSETPLAPNAEGELEIRMGQKGSFKAVVLEKGEVLPTDNPRAELRYSKRGLGVGDIKVDGAYQTPQSAPTPPADTFTVLARSAADPTKTATVTIRLLDAEGKRLAAPEPPKEE